MNASNASLSTNSPPPSPRPYLPGVNVAGYVSSEFGLGEAVRTTIRALEAVEIPVAINNFEFNPHRKQDTTYRDRFSSDNPYPVNIIQVNVDAVDVLLQQVDPSYFQNRYNIGIWVWELPEFPEHWRPLFGIFHEIWVPSHYALEAIAAVSPVPVMRLPHSIQLATPQATRADLEIPAETFVFLFMFDFCSVYERKNPEAVIQAFRQAFGDAPENVQLIIKSSNGEHYPQERQRLQEAAQGCAGIRFIDGYLLRDQLDGLLYHCDCYVSLHRSEGFGLTLAEAMFYGKPVIATAYSANTEYMNVGNSLLVPYQLQTLKEDYGPYRAGNRWAEPDVAEAARWMRWVYEERDRAQALGDRAAQDIRQQLSPQAVGQIVQRRLQAIQHFTGQFSSLTPTAFLQTQVTHARMRYMDLQVQMSGAHQDLLRLQAEKRDLEALVQHHQRDTASYQQGYEEYRQAYEQAAKDSAEYRKAYEDYHQAYQEAAARYEEQRQQTIQTEQAFQALQALHALQLQQARSPLQKIRDRLRRLRKQ